MLGRGWLRLLESTYSMTTVLETYVSEALKLRGPDEAYRIRCPFCETLLGEYIFGVFKAKCRRCSGIYVIVRASASLVSSVFTVKQGEERRLPQQEYGNRP